MDFPPKWIFWTYKHMREVIRTGALPDVNSGKIVRAANKCRKHRFYHQNYV